MKFQKHKKLNGRTQPEILIEFMKGLKQAEAAAGCLGTMLRNVEFFGIADTLHQVSELAPSLAISSSGLRWHDEVTTVTSYGAPQKPGAIIASSEPVSTPTKFII